MRTLKAYFNSTNSLLLILPFFLFILAFAIHYLMVIGYLEDLYKFHSLEVRNRILSDEIMIYKINLLGYIAVYIFQIIGVTIGLNIGLLFFGYKFSFKHLLNIVLKSSIVLVAIYLFIPIIYYITESVYNFEDLYNIESKNYTLLRWFNDMELKWMKNAFEMISITQIIFLIFLAYGIKLLLNLNYKKALQQTSKIYIIMIFIFMCFTLVMDLNFNQ